MSPYIHFVNKSRFNRWVEKEHLLQLSAVKNGRTSYCKCFSHTKLAAMYTYPKAICKGCHFVYTITPSSDHIIRKWRFPVFEQMRMSLMYFLIKTRASQSEHLRICMLHPRHFRLSRIARVLSHVCSQVSFAEAYNTIGFISSVRMDIEKLES